MGRGNGLPVDRRLVFRMEQEDLLIGRVVRRDIVEDEEVERHLGVVGIVDREHPTVEPRQTRPGNVGGGNVAGKVGVNRRRLFGVCVNVLHARHRAGIVGAVRPGRERTDLARLLLSVDRRTGLQNDRVVRDGRLVVLRVMVRSIRVVGTGVARKESLVVDLERARVGVIVVPRHAPADLHHDRRGFVESPRALRDHLPEPGAVVGDQIQIVVAAVLIPDGVPRLQDQVENIVDIGVILERRPTHRRIVVEEVRRDHTVKAERSQRLAARSALVVALFKHPVVTVGDVDVGGTHDLFHISFARVGERAGRGFDEPRAPEVGAEAQRHIVGDPLRNVTRLVVDVADRDELLVEAPRDKVPPAGVLVVDRDGKREVVAQDLPLGAVPRHRLLCRRREADFHAFAGVVRARNDLLLDAENDLFLVGRREKIVAPVVDARGGEHNVPVLAFLVARHRLDIDGFQIVFDRVDRPVAREQIPGQPVVERKRLDVVQDFLVVVVGPVRFVVAGVACGGGKNTVGGIIDVSKE